MLLSNVLIAATFTLLLFVLDIMAEPIIRDCYPTPPNTDKLEVLTENDVKGRLSPEGFALQQRRVKTLASQVKDPYPWTDWAEITDSVALEQDRILDHYAGDDDDATSIWLLYADISRFSTNAGSIVSTKKYLEANNATQGSSNSSR